jgi:DNA polymerase-4
MHVDMDAFYASVEQRRRPDLAGVPMWVGGERRGVVLSANYAARAWGVRGGMSSAHARRLCPHAVALRPDFDAYTEVSQGILAVLESVSPAVESASIDEAYLDVTTVVGGWGSARAIGEHLRALVADEQRITCSVGIGPNRLLAKMASVAAKPDGLVEVAPGQVEEFLLPLPVERLVGVGESTAARLHAQGIVTIADLAAAPTVDLQRRFGRRAGALLAELARGRDHSRVVSRPGERGVGNQETFGADTADAAVISAELLRLALKVSARLRAAGQVGRTLTLHVRYPVRGADGCHRRPPRGGAGPARPAEPAAPSRPSAGVAGDGARRRSSRPPPAGAGRAGPGLDRGRAGERRGHRPLRSGRGAAGRAHRQAAAVTPPARASPALFRNGRRRPRLALHFVHDEPGGGEWPSPRTSRDSSLRWRPRSRPRTRNWPTPCGAPRSGGCTAAVRRSPGSVSWSGSPPWWAGCSPIRC